MMNEPSAERGPNSGVAVPDQVVAAKPTSRSCAANDPIGSTTSSQFPLTQAAALLVFAGIWAIMRGIVDVTVFFTMRSAADAIPAE
jgi:hypothetical protein